MVSQHSPLPQHALVVTIILWDERHGDGVIHGTNKTFGCLTILGIERFLTRRRVRNVDILSGGFCSRTSAVSGFMNYDENET